MNNFGAEGLRGLWIALVSAGLWLAAGVPAAAQDYAAQVSELVSAISKAMVSAGKRSVAVLDLADANGRPVCLGQLLAEEVSVGLVSAGQGFETISRNDGKLKAVMNEQRLGTTGAIDPQSAAKVGQLVGVQALVTGTIFPIGDRVRVTLTLIDSTSARIVGAAATQIARTKVIEEYLTPCTSASTTPKGVTLGANQPSPSDTPLQPPGPTAVTPTLGGAATRPAEPMAKPGPIRPPAAIRATASGLLFELEACRWSEAIVTCTLSVRNDLSQTNLMIIIGGGAAGSRAYGDAGSEYPASEGRLGSKSQFAPPLGAMSFETLPTGAPVRAVISFRNIPATLPRFVAIDLGCQTLGGRGTFRVELRDVPIVH
jgi:TolB-like protein